MPLQTVEHSVIEMKADELDAGHGEPDLLVEVRSKGVAAGNLAFSSSIPEKLANRINEVGDSLKVVCSKLAAHLGELSSAQPSGWGLNEVELRFSLDLEAEAGVLITRGKTRGGFEARLMWRHQSE